MKRALLLTILMASALQYAFAAETTLILHGSQAAPGDTTQLTLSLTGTEEISAFEANIMLGRSMTIIAATIDSTGTPSDHIVRASQQPSARTAHIGCWSPTNAALKSRIVLLVEVSSNIRKGNYSLLLSDVLLVTTDGVSLSSPDLTAMIEINNDGHSDKFAEFFPNAPMSQAWYLRNTSTDLYLHLSDITSKVTLEKPDVSNSQQQFFVEPAYGSEEGLYYLRNVDGSYLCFLPNASSYDISIARQPTPSSTFALTETGDRTYALTIAGSTARLAASGSTAGQELQILTGGTRSQWQLLKAEASHISYLERLCLTSAQCTGLTQGRADFDLRLLRHSLRIAMDDGMDDQEAAAAIDRLGEAVKRALKAYAEGDTSVVETQWLAAEKITSAAKVITTTDAGGKTLFLSITDGKPALTDLFTVITPDKSASLLQDAFYNPTLDAYAIRLSGPDANNSGTYLTTDATTAALTDTTVTTLTERLGQWTVLSEQQAMQRYLTFSGKSGSSVNWDFDMATGTLTFKGVMRTNSYVKPESRPWHLYRHLVRHAVFAGEIRLLGAYLLAGCTNIEDMTFIADTPPVPGEQTFDGIPEGIVIYAPLPEAFEGYLSHCHTHPLLQVQEKYLYDGTRQTPVVEGPYATTVVNGELQTDAGTYTSSLTIAISIGSATHEYTRAFPYTILPAPMTIYADHATRSAGEANPPFTYTCKGFVDGDDESVLTAKPVLTCEADSQSPPGEYPIHISGGEAHNYDITHVTGTLTVTDAAGVKPAANDGHGTHYTVRDLQGRPVATDKATAKNLPRGIYIENRKKFILK